MMTQRTVLLTLTVSVFSCAALIAQGPPPGGRGFGGGFGARGAGILGAGPGFRKVITNAPYSATETLTSQQTLANGNQISNKSQTNVYRDSAGRVCTVQTVTPAASTGKAPYTVTTIFDPVAGYSYVLNSSNMTARQTPLPRPPASSSTGATPPQRPANPNVVVTNLGTQSVNGVSATGTQTVDTIPAGAIGNAQPIQSSRTVWTSTALSVPVSIQTSNPRLGTSDMELTNIVQSEPSATLFTVPSGYTITTGRGPGGPGGPGSANPGFRGRQPAPAQ